MCLSRLSRINVCISREKAACASSVSERGCPCKRGKSNRYSHGMRNAMRIWLKWLHRLTQCSRFFLATHQKYVCPLETGGSESMLASQFTDELNLVAHPVGD